MTSYSAGSRTETSATETSTRTTDTETEVWTLPDELYALQPDAARRLDRVNQRAWETVDPTLLELVRLRVGQLIGDRAGTRTRSSAARRAGLSEEKIADLAAYPTSPRFAAAERECLAFVEQFVMDVSGTTPESLAALAEVHGREGLADLVTAVYVVEFTQRLQLVTRLLLAPADVGAAVTADRADPELPDRPDRSLWSWLASYQSAVVRGKALDPTITELVRLRCARTHRCRICSTLRLADARDVGVDETMTAKIDFYEKSDLPERSKVALRITDALIVLPELLTEPTVAAAREFFNPEQRAELCLDVTKWSTQKILVALGADGTDDLPINEAGTAYVDFDDRGHVVGYSAS